MHLKILIGVLTLGIASASPRAAPKPAAKASPQIFSGPEQPYYVPVESNAYGQQISAQPYPGQSRLVYNTGFVPSSYGYSAGSNGVPLYPQTLAGNHYQHPQLIPVPVAYSNPSSNGVHSPSYHGTPKLWPKNNVSPTGSPSPAPVSPASYYTSSNSRPVSYQSTTNYANHLVPYSATNPSPVEVQQPQLIPVPVKVDSRNSFHPEITNYNTPKNVPFPVSTQTSYVASYQQSTPAPFVQSYQQPSAFHYSTYQQQAGNPYVPQHQQQPTAIPYHVNYQPSTQSPSHYQHGYQQNSAPDSYKVSYQQPTPAPYEVGYHQSTPAFYQVQYQHTTPAPYQVSYQQSTPASYQAKYQHSTPTPYQVSYQQSTPAPPVVTYSSAAPLAGYQQQSSSGHNLAQNQQPSGSHYGNDQYSKAYPFLANYQSIPVPVGYPDTNFQGQHDKATVTNPVSIAQRSSFSTTTKPVTIQQIPKIHTPVKIVTITEKPFVPIPSTPSPFSQTKAAVVKTEYNVGAVSPQYNHIPSSYGLNHQVFPTGPHTAKPTASYLPSTAASHVSYNGPGASYSY